MSEFPKPLVTISLDEYKQLLDTANAVVPEIALIEEALEGFMNQCIKLVGYHQRDDVFGMYSTAFAKIGYELTISTQFVSDRTVKLKLRKLKDNG